MAGNALEVLDRSHDPTRAAVLCSALHAHGIPAEVLDRHVIGRSWWHQFALSGARVAIRAEDLERARQLLADLAASAPDPAPMRRRTRPLFLSLAIAAFVLGVHAYAGIPIVWRPPIVDEAQ